MYKINKSTSTFLELDELMISVVVDFGYEFTSIISLTAGLSFYDNNKNNEGIIHFGYFISIIKGWNYSLT